MILVICDDYENEIEQMNEIFEEYANNIIIIISHSEKVSISNKEEICCIMRENYGINNIIFTEKDTNAYKLCYDLNEIQKNMKNIDNLRIDTNILIKQKRIKSPKEILEQRKKFEKKFYDDLAKFKAKVNDTKDSDLIRALYFCFYDYKANLYYLYANSLENIRIKGKQLDENSIICAVLQFSNEIKCEFNDFRKYIENKLEVKLNNYNGEYNKFKRCPICNLIWFKVVGWDSIQCGKRTGIKDKFFGFFKHYKVSFINEQIIIESNDEGDNKSESANEFYGLTEEEKIKNIELKKKGKKELSPLGCGNTLSWTEMEDVSEQVIKQLQEDSLSDDYYSGFFKFTNKNK